MTRKRTSRRAEPDLGCVELVVRSDTSMTNPSVRLARSLRLSDAADGWAEDNPMVTITVTHSDVLDSRAGTPIHIEGLRSSEIDGFLESLEQAVRTARKARILPPALTDDEIRRRVGAFLGATA